MKRNAIIGAALAGVLTVGIIGTQAVHTSSTDDATLAAARSNELSASRGAARGENSSLSGAIAAQSNTPGFGAPADVADATTTTTTAPPVATEPTATGPTDRVASPQAVAAAQQPQQQAHAFAPPAAPTPTTTVAPKPAPQRSSGGSSVLQRQVTTTTTAAPRSGDTGIIGDDVWARMAWCESGNRNWSSGPYYGYFQFLPSTWRSLGGTGLPSDHTYLEQKALAIALQARSGWGQWPVCSKKAGAA